MQNKADTYGQDSESEITDHCPKSKITEVIKSSISAYRQQALTIGITQRLERANSIQHELNYCKQIAR